MKYQNKCINLNSFRLTCLIFVKAIFLFHLLCAKSFQHLKSANYKPIQDANKTNSLYSDQSPSAGPLQNLSLDPGVCAFYSVIVSRICYFTLLAAICQNKNPTLKIMMYKMLACTSLKIYFYRKQPLEKFTCRPVLIVTITFSHIKFQTRT